MRVDTVLRARLLIRGFVEDGQSSIDVAAASPFLKVTDVLQYSHLFCQGEGNEVVDRNTIFGGQDAGAFMKGIRQS
jgi:hypothetical protein